MDANATQNPEKKECGWVKLYTAQGVLVTIPVTEQPMDYAAMLANVGKMLDAGFYALAPGLEVGEEKQVVGWVVRGAVEGQNGEVSDKIIVYSDREEMKFAILVVYLDTPEDVADFEYASGLKLNDLKVYIGKDKPERGASRMHEQFFVKPAKPLSVVSAPNPKFKQSECDAAKAKNQVYKPAKMRFIRWGEQRPKPDATTKTNKQGATDQAKQPQTMADMLKRIQEWENKNIEANRCAKGDVWNYLARWANEKRVIVNGVALAGRPPEKWPDAAIPQVVEAIKGFKVPNKQPANDGPY